MENSKVIVILTCIVGVVIPNPDATKRLAADADEWTGEPHPCHTRPLGTLPKCDEINLDAYPAVKSSHLGMDGVGQERKSTMPPRRSTPKTLHWAGELRKQTTPAEKKLWAYLRLMRADGIRFRRQHAIGPFIVDFCSPRKKIIIELDGSQHLEQEEYDAERTALLKSKGYRVLRFWNHEVLNDTDDVMRIIDLALEDKGKDQEEES